MTNYSPNKRIATDPGILTLAEAAYITPPCELTDTEAMLDMSRLRMYRLNRIREQIVHYDLGAVVLTEPLSIRYATGVRNCALFQTHIHAGYLFIAAEGPVVFFDSGPGLETGAQLETIDEVRDDILPLSYMFAGKRIDEWAKKWVQQISDLVNQHCPNNKRLGVEKAGTRATQYFEQSNIEVHDAVDILAMARSIKSVDEVLCMNQVIAVTEDGITRLRGALRPGITENKLWSHMWAANIEAGGEWIEYRLFGSGNRTNPWQQESSSKRIRAGDLVCLDCGTVGPFGYGADYSRAFHCGPGKPTTYQKSMYTAAYTEVMHNTELMQPGASFAEIVANRYVQKGGFGDQPYPCLAHGIGMGDEWPVIYYPQEEEFAFDGELLPGMVITVESYVGEIGGVEGVKLENEVLISETGPIVLSRYPFEDSLLTKEI